MAKQKFITNWDDVPEIFDIPYAMRLYGISRPTAYSMCNDGTLPAKKIGKLWRFSKRDVIKHLESLGVGVGNAG